MPMTPAPDEVLTIEPPPCSSIAGISYFMHKKALRRSMSINLDQSSSVVSTSAVGGCSTPALLNATSSRPRSRTVRSTRSLISLEDVTSQGTARTRPPCTARMSAVSSLPAASMSAKTTSAPSVAKAAAVARPMPLPAPVTTATFPANLRSVIFRLTSCLLGVALGARRSTTGSAGTEGGTQGDAGSVALGDRTAVAVTQFNLQLLQRAPLGLGDAAEREQRRQHVEHEEPGEHGHRAVVLGENGEEERDEGVRDPQPAERSPHGEPSNRQGEHLREHEEARRPQEGDHEGRHQQHEEQDQVRPQGGLRQQVGDEEPEVRGRNAAEAEEHHRATPHQAQDPHADHREDDHRDPD